MLKKALASVRRVFAGGDGFAADRPIALTLTCVSVTEVGATLSWMAEGAPDVAPDDLIFDLDFLGQPSGITTVFLWDAVRDRLEEVYVTQGDTAFVLTKGFAYAGLSQDGSGRVRAAWALRESGGRLALVPGESLRLMLDPDSSVDRIRRG